MTEPTTEAGKWLESEEPYLTTWAWGSDGTPVIPAIEAEARAAVLRELREDWQVVCAAVPQVVVGPGTAAMLAAAQRIDRRLEP